MKEGRRFFDNSGRPITLGKKIGVGGEGSVFELSDRSTNFVAKLYHQGINREKQEKLRAMVQRSSESISKVAAWPCEILHLRDGRVCGFLMPRIGGFEPVHCAYGPAHRKQQFPQFDWSSLVLAARNISVAFQLLHSLGIILGDVNQGNVVVAKNCLVKLIDCDSFQISHNRKLYLCEVGVSHFTPPELQNLRSFRDVPRTVNHDNFGLALLCFHLLFMGRHPFSGVYAGRDDMPIEKAISTFRFAFGTNARDKGMAPPPNSVQMDIVPYQVRNLFERAFSEYGTKEGERPMASEWIQALDFLKVHIVRCQNDTSHKFFSGLQICPWCNIERKAGVIFFVGMYNQDSFGKFNLAAVWQKIIAVPEPGEAPVIDPVNWNAVSKPLPKKVKNAKIRFVFRRICAIIIGISVIAIGNPAIIVIGFIFALGLFFTKADDFGEKSTRKKAFDNARSKWDETNRRWKYEAGNRMFSNKLKELSECKKNYEGLGAEYAKGKQKLAATVKERQLYRFLERFIIDDYKISNIGQARKAILRSFGIETAADIEAKKVRRIKGFGDSLTKNLLDWRASVVRKFVFGPSKGIDPKDLGELNKKFNQKKRQLEASLLSGPEILNKIRSQAFKSRELLKETVVEAAQTYAQAEADMKVIN